LPHFESSAIAIGTSAATSETQLPMAKSGDWPGARDALESRLKLAPGQMSARLLLGHIYPQLKDAGVSIARGSV